MATEAKLAKFSNGGACMLSLPLDDAQKSESQ